MPGIFLKDAFIETINYGVIAHLTGFCAPKVAIVYSMTNLALRVFAHALNVRNQAEVELLAIGGGLYATHLLDSDISLRVVVAIPIAQMLIHKSTELLVQYLQRGQRLERDVVVIEGEMEDEDPVGPAVLN